MHASGGTPSGSGRGVHYSCKGCSIGLCGVCGAPWCLGELSHAGLSCAAYERAGREARVKEGGGKASFEAYGLPSEETLVGLCKVCPNPVCGNLISHARGHACHSVTCKCGLTLCFVCLATEEEKGESWHSVCPSFCSPACGCVPCPECAQGTACELCQEPAGTGCPCCKHGGRGETPQEAEERLARGREAVAALRLRAPAWPGPRSFRTDIPKGLPRGGGGGGQRG